jgi:hypothetical protein
MRKAFAPLFAAIRIAAACGGRSSPTSPSSTASGSSATITGVVQGATSALTSASGGASLSGVTVSVLGTSISAAADVAGRFTLMNVPPGAVQLQLTGGGANAIVSLSPVSAQQTIDVVLAVSGPTATVESEVRSGTSEAQLEGRVESLPPTQPALTFKAAGRLVRTDSATRFVDGSQTRTFADLRIGMRVHAKGSLAGEAFQATVVELQNSNTTLPVNVNGAIDSVTGTASAFQFKIGSRVVKGDAQTTFFGDGDAPDSFSSLKEGTRVEVKGEQRDDYIYAVRIHINDSDGDDDGDQDSSASIHGTLNAMTGSKPALVLTVGTTIVRTSASTEVKRRGDVQTLDQLKLGQSLHVIGTRQSDGSIDARRIEINDDDTGGEFEIEGSLGGLKGTCPSIQFSVNGFSIATSGTTAFEGGTCSALKSGDKVTVKGTRNADGSVSATKVTRK